MKRLFSTPLAIVFALLPTCATAGVLFESGALGPTGVSWQDALDGIIPGSSVASDVFSGVRFELTQPATTTQIGGHFFSPSGGTFFGAIIQLEDQNDFPDSADLSTPDVLGTVLLTFPVDSAEVYSNFNSHLTAGWYALVFGSGLFGTDGEGGMVLNNPDIGMPTYIARQTGPSWFNLSDLSDAREFVDFRFVVNGHNVPELSTFCMAYLLLAIFACIRRR